MMAAASRSTISLRRDRARTRSSRASAATTPPIEIARGVPRAPSFPKRSEAPEDVETPDITTCEDLAGFLGIDLAATSKAMPVVADGQVVLALVRGDDRLDEGKLAAALGVGSRPAQTDEIREAFGAEPGSLGPVGFRGRIVLDEALGRVSSSPARTARAITSGASSAAGTSRPRSRTSVSRGRGDTCPALWWRPAVPDGDRGRSHLQARHVLLGAARCDLPRRAVGRASDRDGGYGIGPGRVLAAVVEQGHDERGIVWPRSVAPYDIHVLASAAARPRSRACRRTSRRSSRRPATTCSSTTAMAVPGKFADADLLGVPIRVTVGKKSLEDGALDVRRRTEISDTRVDRASVIDWARHD